MNAPTHSDPIASGSTRSIQLTDTPVVWNSGAINAQWILAHMNELSADDLALLGNLPRGGKPTIVHCPGTHHYFGREPFGWRRLQELGVNLCVGTDSLASTNSLSLLSELRRLWPDAEFFGCTGPRMRDAGVRTVVDSASLAVVGLLEVVSHIPRIYGEYRKLLGAVRQSRPDLAIL